MTLNKVNENGNTFCGPGVISAITGIGTKEIERITQQIRRNSKPVRGMYTSELCEILHRLGWKTSYVNGMGGSLFYALGVLDTGVYIVMVPGHFVCVEIDENKQRYFVDNHTKRPINAAVSARGMQRVHSVVRVER
jgi:hypothetical protein